MLLMLLFLTINAYGATCAEYCDVLWKKERVWKEKQKAKAAYIHVPPDGEEKNIWERNQRALDLLQVHPDGVEKNICAQGQSNLNVWKNNLIKKINIFAYCDADQLCFRLRNINMDELMGCMQPIRNILEEAYSVLYRSSRESCTALCVQWPQDMGERANLLLPDIKKSNVDLNIETYFLSFVQLNVDHAEDLQCVLQIPLGSETIEKKINSFRLWLESLYHFCMNQDIAAKKAYISCWL